MCGAPAQTAAASAVAAAVAAAIAAADAAAVVVAVAAAIGKGGINREGGGRLSVAVDGIVWRDGERQYNAYIESSLI